MRSIVILFTFLVNFSTYALRLDEAVSKTTINLMWINKEKPQSADPPNQYIFPEPLERGISVRIPGLKEIINMVNRLTIWAGLNPHAKIRLWYDGKTVTDIALENTKNLLKNLRIEIEGPSGFAPSKIELVDINEKLKAYEKLFDEQLPIYFRADILRVLATYETLREKHETPGPRFELFAHFDWTVDPIKLENLYQYGKGLKYIDDYGIMFGTTDKAVYENSFHVMGSDNEFIRDSLLRVTFQSLLTDKEPLLRYGDENVNRSAYKMVFRAFGDGDIKAHQGIFVPFFPTRACISKLSKLSN